MNKKRLFLSMISALLVMCFLTSCGSKASGGDSKKGYKADKIRINYSHNYGMVVPHVINLLGLLDDKLPEGVTVEWSTLDTSSAIRDAIAAGKIDIGAITSVNAVAAFENDVPIYLLANAGGAIQQLYSNNPDIKSLDDIKPNHKIAMNNIGAISHVALMLISKEKYGDYQKFNDNLLVMTNVNMVASLTASDDIDCAAVSFPFSVAVDKLDKLTPILDFTPTIQKYQLGMFFVGASEFADDNPALVDIVLEAAQEAMDYLNNNTAEAAELLSGIYNVDAAEIEALLKAAPLTLEISESAYNEVAELLYEVKIIPDPPKKLADLPNYDSISKTE